MSTFPPGGGACAIEEEHKMRLQGTCRVPAGWTPSTSGGAAESTSSICACKPPEEPSMCAQLSEPNITANRGFFCRRASPSKALPSCLSSGLGPTYKRSPRPMKGCPTAPEHCRAPPSSARLCLPVCLPACLSVCPVQFGSRLALRALRSYVAVCSAWPRSPYSFTPTVSSR